MFAPTQRPCCAWSELLQGVSRTTPSSPSQNSETRMKRFEGGRGGGGQFLKGLDLYQHVVVLFGKLISYQAHATVPRKRKRLRSLLLSGTGRDIHRPTV
eukprot:2884610-Rhodomonas_salina.1